MTLERIGAASGVLAFLGPLVLATLQALGLPLSHTELWIALGVEIALILLVVVWFFVPLFNRLRKKSQINIEDGPSVRTNKSEVRDIHGKNVSINQGPGGITGDVKVSVGKTRRTLAGPDLQGLEAVLRGAGSRDVGLLVAMGDGETVHFGDEIEKLILRVGWTIAPNGIIDAMFNPPLTGIHIDVHASKPADIDQAIVKLATWLASHNLGPVKVVMDGPNPNSQINVGYAP